VTHIITLANDSGINLHFSYERIEIGLRSTLEPSDKKLNCFCVVACTGSREMACMGPAVVFLGAEAYPALDDLLRMVALPFTETLFRVGCGSELFSTFSKWDNRSLQFCLR
jgi:hypothetical protein